MPDPQTNPQHVMPHAMSRIARTYVQITSAQLLALNAAPITLVAAPGAGKALIFEGMSIQKPTGTAYAGIAAGDSEQTQQMAHRFKGAAGYITAGRLGDLAAELEAMGREGDLSRAAATLDVFRAELDRCLESIDAYLAGVPAAG